MWPNENWVTTEAHFAQLSWVESGFNTLSKQIQQNSANSPRVRGITPVGENKVYGVNDLP